MKLPYKEANELLDSTIASFRRMARTPLLQNDESRVYIVRPEGLKWSCSFDKKKDATALKRDLKKSKAQIVSKLWRVTFIGDFIVEEVEV